MTESFIRFAGWTSYTNAGLTIANIVTIMIFFAVGGFWGRLNDSVSVLWALSFIPLSIVLYRLNAMVNAPLSLLAVVLGVAAMIIFAVLQTWLVVGPIRFEQTLGAVLAMTGILGLSLILNGLMARAGGTMPQILAWLTVAYGLGFIIGGIGFHFGGQQHPLAAFGFLVTFLVGPVWAIWVGRLLLAGTLYSPVAVSAGGQL